MYRPCPRRLPHGWPRGGPCAVARHGRGPLARRRVAPCGWTPLRRSTDGPAQRQRRRRSGGLRSNGRSTTPPPIRRNWRCEEVRCGLSRMRSDHPTPRWCRNSPTRTRRCGGCPAPWSAATPLRVPLRSAAAMRALSTRWVCAPRPSAARRREATGPAASSRATLQHAEPKLRRRHSRALPQPPPRKSSVGAESTRCRPPPEATAREPIGRSAATMRFSGAPPAEKNPSPPPSKFRFGALCAAGALGTLLRRLLRSRLGALCG